MTRLLSITLVCLLQVSLAVASTFNLRVEVTPVGAGSLNISEGAYEEGSKINLRTSGHTGYVFKGWYEGETLLSSSTSFSYTMPSANAVVQARYEYDPAVPGNPAMPDTTTYFSLTAQVSPIGAGTLNTTSGKYAAGAKVNLRTYNNTGYQFVGWQNDEGETLSSSTSFNYTMPRHDSQLTAMYVYDPTVPANPDSMATRYTVSVACKPVGGGTFNTTNATAEEGGNVHLYAYTNTGYKFLRWENEAGETISTAQNFYYVIPHGNSNVYGVFEFDPAVPSNPNKNYWNKELGELIIDDFTPGSLGSAVSSAISGSSSNDVAMITVAGRMTDNDFGIANNYKNCTLLDLSRVTGVTAVPSYAFDYTNLESVYLPATIEKIGYRAFYECKQLSSLIVYAIVPPALESQVFTKVPEGLIVYVPATSVSQYQEAEGWKNFTILPLQDDVRSITVSLAEGANAKDYSKMWLELTNTKNGQRLHYVMTDRTQYTFANIIRNTSWEVVLRNERGDVFGKIDNVDVKDEDVSVTFSSLSKPQTVVLSVLTPDGLDVTSQTQVTWTDATGNYLAQGISLTGLPIGYQVGYRVVLSQDLAMTYLTPQQADYVLKDGDNNITCQLVAISTVQISGKVKDVANGQPISGATISASQTFGGKYSKTLNTKTDGNGLFAFEIAKVPTSVAFAASDYISQTRNYSDNELNELNELEDVLLKSITGAIISLDFTYTTCDGEIQGWYSDYNNVSYTIYNKTRQRSISQYNVQYPQIVLLEEVDDGDVLQLTATSRTGAFVPVESTATVAEQKASTTFAIVELGKIQASFTTTGNASVVGSLYDASGKLLKTYNYSDASLTISDLADGQYTLVSMGGSRLFNTIYDLAQLPQTGLVQDNDYVQNTVEVKSGAISQISIAEVPTLDESKLYYTGDNTSFTVNKPSIVAGNYLTLTGRIDFKSAYATSVSNVQLIVDLPESCQFVENSVMVGNSTSSYTLNGNRITIPMVRYTDRVRFCIIPTLGGEYAPSAFAQFDLNGETVTQPIGSANYIAKDLSISVPSTVAKTAIPVSGTAIGKSDVEIYDDGVLIGQTTSLANGTWATTCELNEPYNLSTHNIFAKVTTKAGIGLMSETVNCLYDKNAIEVNTVTMINTAHTSTTCDFITVFDFQHNTTSPSSYNYWPSYPDFTFVVDLTNNDTTIVSNVIVNVFTGQNEVRQLKATYNNKLDKWVAVSKFSSGNLPVNVTVDFVFKDDIIYDRDELAQNLHDIEVSVDVALNEVEELRKGLIIDGMDFYDDAFSKLSVLLGDTNVVWNDSIETLIRYLQEAYYPEKMFSNEDLQNIEFDSNAIDQLISEIDDEFMNWIANIYLTDSTMLPIPDIDGSYVINTNEGIFKLNKIRLGEINIDDLKAQGYQRVPLTDGGDIYYFYTEDGYVFINTSDSIQYQLHKTEPNVYSQVKRRIPQIFQDLKGCIEGFKDTTNDMKSLVKKLKSYSDVRDVLPIVDNLLDILADMQDNLECLYDGGIDGLVKSANDFFVEKLAKIQSEIISAEKTVAKTYKLYQDAIKDAAFFSRMEKEHRALAQSLYDAWATSTDAAEKQVLLQKALKATSDADGYQESARAARKLAKIYLEDWENAQKILAKVTKKLDKIKAIQKATMSVFDKIPNTLRVAKAYKSGKNVVSKIVKFVGSPLGTLLQAIPLYLEIDEMITELGKWSALYHKIEAILPCPGDSLAAYNLYNEVKHSYGWHIVGYSSTVCADAVGMALDFATVSWIASLICDVYSLTVGWFNNTISDSNLKWYNARYDMLDCTKTPNPYQPFLPPVKPIMDPSGYVYEGVSSNRLEGVTATAYYKENVEDMYGDLHENIVKWDAEEYAQENPLFTDEYGMYAWDVPQGLWQVKFEKEGYETTYSEWLPVPPPQLDVNIPMVQNRQPEVKMAHAYEDGVEIEFDKYMSLESLTTDNIIVSQDGDVVDGSISFLNEEVAYEGKSESYASRVRFNADKPFTSNEILLIVSNKVKSYAGIQMQDVYTQSFGVEKQIRAIDADSIVNVVYGEGRTINVSVIPAEASAGKMLKVKSSSPMILSVDKDSYTLDENGKAEITISGELPGFAQLSFSIEDVNVTGYTGVNVVDKSLLLTAAPIASIASGTVVEKGTEITLSCKTEGATIYYTTDGSCPCDETGSRKVYDGTPIVINETTTLKVMAVGKDMYESDVVTYYYIVESTGIREVTSKISIYPLVTPSVVHVDLNGLTAESIAVSSLNGVAVTMLNNVTKDVTIDLGQYVAGMYIVSVKCKDNSIVRKVIKVNR